MNGAVGKFRAQATQKAKQMPQQARQAALGAAKQQSNEFIKSAKDQVVSGEKPVEGSHGDLYSQLSEGGGEGVDTGQIAQSEAALMSRLKSQLEQEMAKARGERQQAYQQWSEEQTQTMADSERTDEPIDTGHGKQKQGPGGPAGGRLKQKQSKEVGRGAKN